MSAIPGAGNIAMTGAVDGQATGERADVAPVEVRSGSTGFIWSSVVVRRALRLLGPRRPGRARRRAANPYLIRERTGLDEGDTNTVLNRLGRGGYVEQVTRGLSELAPEGRDALYLPASGEDDVGTLRERLEAVERERDDLREELEWCRERLDETGHS